MSFRDETGAAAVLVAAAMLVLMGFAAVAIDGGLGFDERRSAQNAADHAALTAAWAECTGSADPAADGLASANENGYNNTLLPDTVTMTQLAAGIWQADIESINDAQFATMVGVSELIVNVSAIADCSQIVGLGGYALFASGTECGPFEMSFTGASATFDGDIHSNGRLKLNGSESDPTTVNGDITYVETYSQVGVIENGLVQQVPILPSPGGWEMDDYDDPTEIGTTAHAAFLAGEYTVIPDGTSFHTETLADGLYYSPGSFSLHDVTASSVTLVAEGQITLTGTNNINADGDPLTPDAGPWDPTGLGLFSTHIDDGSPCNNTAIDWSGDAHNWSGVQFAPNGKVDMSGASNSSLNGAIIAYTISLPGSGTSISYDDTFTGVAITTLALTD